MVYERHKELMCECPASGYGVRSEPIKDQLIKSYHNIA